MSTPHPATPPAGSRPAVERLRTDLSAADFTVQGLGAVLDDVAAAALHREQRVPALLAARRAGTPAATLLRLFLLGDEVARTDVEAALPATGVAGAAALGLLEAAGSGPSDPVRALVDLRPYAATDPAGAAHWWVASDLGELATGAALPPDHVLGIGGASVTLAQLTLRTPRRRALDLGTGCGVQALHAARHCADVVATDVSARALAYAAFNAALAGVELDLRAGSLLQPVAGEEFDLVVSNPPFVITPPAAYAAGLPLMEYRDAGQGGDRLVRDLVTGLGAHLAPGGVAQLLGNWEHHHGEDWQERVTEWVRATGLDAWVVQREVQDPAEYAELWLRDGGLRTTDRDRYEAVYAAWLADFAARGVSAVGFGYVLLHRPERGTPPWRRVEELTGPVHSPLGAHVATVLAAHAWLTAVETDGGIARTRLRRAPDVTEERYVTPGEADPRVLQLRQGSGFGRVRPVGTAAAGAVGACDGELTVGQIITGLAAVLAQPAAQVAAEVLPVLRELVLDGFLLPA